MNLRFKSIRRSGTSSTLHKNAVKANKKAIAKKKEVTTRQAAHDKATKQATESKTAAVNKSKDAKAAREKAVTMKGKPGAKAASGCSRETAAGGTKSPKNSKDS